MSYFHSAETSFDIYLYIQSPNWDFYCASSLFCPMHSVEHNSNVHFAEANDWQVLRERIKNTTGKIYLLVDTNTLQYCYPHLLHFVPELKKSEIIEIEPGEDSKDLQICFHIWRSFTEHNAGRDSLLINLGGGVLSDLGGFVASVYKRGISFIHLPTTLLAMVDAAIGGKTGIDFMDFKNQLGTFSRAEHIFIWQTFLGTLPESELISGFAEVMKHALIADSEFWSRLCFQKIKLINWNEIIPHAVKIKEDIVAEDPMERGKRKLLNFGHSMGHAIESLFLEKNKAIRHGEAVAAGMICELYLSGEILGLGRKKRNEIVQQIDSHFSRLAINEEDIPNILQKVSQDKKNMDNKLLFSLLKNIGDGKWDVEVESKLLEKSILFYMNKLE